MRIATYNIWNHPSNWTQRLDAIAQELAFLDADIVALQEAPTLASQHEPLTDFLRRRTGYEHALQFEETGNPGEGEQSEGLAFLSKLPLTEARTSWVAQETANNWGARVVVDWQGASVGITNVHLDWEAAASRKRHLPSIIRELVDPRPCNYDIMCGDFNSPADSRVIRFLEGGTDLDGYRTRWRDLSDAWFGARGESPPDTVDFANNPRWQGQGRTDPAVRFDRIYMRTASQRSEPAILGAGIFGREPRNSHGIVPSDHYGVYVDIKVAKAERV